MPSKTKKQARFMAAVARSPSFARKVGVPQSVGVEFNQADKRVMGRIVRRRTRQLRGG